jgi:hypothetical protein
MSLRQKAVTLHPGDDSALLRCLIDLAEARFDWCDSGAADLTHKTSVMRSIIRAGESSRILGRSSASLQAIFKRSLEFVGALRLSNVGASWREDLGGPSERKDHNREQAATHGTDPAQINYDASRGFLRARLSLTAVEVKVFNRSARFRRFPDFQGRCGE